MVKSYKTSGAIRLSTVGEFKGKSDFFSTLKEFIGERLEYMIFNSEYIMKNAF